MVQKSIKTGKNKIVCVVGLGYVGLPLACLLAEKGYRTCGLEVDKSRVDSISKGKSPIKDDFIEEFFRQGRHKLEATLNPTILRKADIIVVCVQTPVNRDHTPNLKPLEEAFKTISRNLRKNKKILIILESTIYPGVTEEYVKPILERAGLKLDVDFLLVHCPERIDPGNKKWHTRNIPRVIGGVDEESLKEAAAFYRSVIDAPIIELSSVKSAEATKIIENTFRDINIAFVNELAKSFDRLGIDTLEVINAAATKPFGFMPHYPGCGVGGHCIPKDPYYLIDKARKTGFDPKFLVLAREINNSMPHYTVRLLANALNDIEKSVKGTRVGVLGVAYKGEVDDMRESPAFEIIHELEQRGALVEVFDPYVKDRSTVSSLDELLRKVEAVVLVTAHPEFRNIDFGKYRKNIRIVVDGRNILDKKSIRRLGIIYKGIGR